MRDVAAELRAWLDEGRPFALATVVRTWSSAPRPAGAVMAVREPSEVIGSLSGGCVEGAAYELSHEVLADGRSRAAHYGVTGSDAVAVGLTCGGELDVVTVRVDPEGDSGAALTEVLAALAEDRHVALALLTGPDDPLLGAMRVVTAAGATGTLGAGERLDAAVADDARGLLALGRARTLTYGLDGQRLGDDREVFVSALAPRPRLVVVGAIDFARAVCRVGAFLGFDVTVVDARPVFATQRRFPEADRVVVDWPHRYLSAQLEAGHLDASSVVTVLTHDPKFDLPLLEVALRSPVGYLGAMGSRKTHDERLEALRDKGFGDEDLARLHSPIGLDLGARTPEETAVSILAEVISTRWGGTGESLSATSGRIHRDDPS